MEFTEEQQAYINEQIEAAKQSINPVFAAEILKKNGGFAFLNEEALKTQTADLYKDEIKATKGNLEHEYRKHVKAVTGLPWEDSEDFSSYAKRVFETKGDAEALKKALDTKEQTYSTKLSEYKTKLKEYETKEWESTLNDIKIKALGNRQFAIPQGLEEEEAKELLELKKMKYDKAFAERFDITKDADGNKILKDKQTGGVYLNNDIQTHVTKCIDELGITFANGDDQQRRNLPNRNASNNNLAKEQLLVHHEQWIKACRDNLYTPTSKEGIRLKAEKFPMLTISNKMKEYAGIK